MKKVVITGATSGIGMEIVKNLIDNNYKVYAIGRNFEKLNLETENLIKIECDISKYQNIEYVCKKIKSLDKIDILINSAGIGYFGLCEEVSANKIHKMIATNLEAPLILIQNFLRDIKKNKGWIINIESITGVKPSPMGLAYSSTKAGLLHFGRGLFDEVRKYGVKVVNIIPDMTKTPFYDNLNFGVSDEEDSYILPICISKNIMNILNQREGTIITELVIRPQKHIIKKK